MLDVEEVQCRKGHARQIFYNFRIRKTTRAGEGKEVSKSSVFAGKKQLEIYKTFSLFSCLGCSLFPSMCLQLKSTKCSMMISNPRKVRSFNRNISKIIRSGFHCISMLIVRRTVCIKIDETISKMNFSCRLEQFSPKDSVRILLQ